MGLNTPGYIVVCFDVFTYFDLINDIDFCWVSLLTIVFYVTRKSCTFNNISLERVLRIAVQAFTDVLIFRNG